MTTNVEGMRRIRLFTGFSDAELEQVVTPGERIALDDGTLIFKEGDPGDALYGIFSGTVRIGKGRGLHARQFQRFLATLEAGEIFGEMALLGAETRSAGALAVGPCELFRLPRAAFETLVAKRDAAAWKLLESLARALAGRIRRIDESLMGLEQRAAGGGLGLADLESLRGDATSRGFVI